MKKMVKGCVMAAIVASMTMFIGCSKASKYESLVEELYEIKLEKRELRYEVYAKAEVKEFKMLSREEQESRLKDLREVLKDRREELKEMKKEAKEIRKKIKEAETIDDLEDLKKKYRSF